MKGTDEERLRDKLRPDAHDTAPPSNPHRDPGFEPGIDDTRDLPVNVHGWREGLIRRVRAIPGRSRSGGTMADEKLKGSIKGDAARRERLVAELRANLRRRKAAAGRLKDVPGADPDTPEKDEKSGS